ncbi:MAG: pyridoxal phosphate-dependent aminotransferase [Gammaproteobacteria bacterium]|nr:pyridoxal phosphate-dependent aminotransferase [Gammaproteobacteria bacterium]MBU2478486.1 pyridoxal phosphate-dependent aminotransferase [Gammaproteobacteria bacterium]
MNNNPPPLAARMTDIQPFHVMALLARARELEAAGRSIVHMEIGEPDFPTAAPIIAAGETALAQGQTHYTPAAGLMPLRIAIAGHYQSRYGVSVDPTRIIVTPGASGALQLVLTALIDPGRQVLMTDPGYPCNRNFVRVVEGETILVPTDAESGYQLTPELARTHWTDATAAMLVASPANPSGTLLTTAQLRELHALALQRGGALIVDEIYHGLTYGCEADTALAISDDIFVINSFSKYFGMTGWRLGWLVAPQTHVEALDRLAQNLFLAAPTLAQHAALAAFTPEAQVIFEQRRKLFAERRDYLLPALRNLGFDIAVEPQGAFYLYAGCERFTQDSFSWCRTLLEEAGVAITPGIDFGNYRANTHVRFAYTTSLEQLQEGVARLGAYLRR